MKRIAAALCLLLTLSGIAHAAFAIFQTYGPGTFNPQVVATENNTFSKDPIDPTQFYNPGYGNPAISTATYWNMSGVYNLRPISLDQMGAVGAAVKSAQGGRPYAWVVSADHPSNGFALRGGESFYVGFSYQPWDFPEKMTEIISNLNGFPSTLYPSTGVTYGAYEWPVVFYNPDDPDGLPIYLFAETGPQHYTTLFRSADFVNWSLWDISHWNDSIPSGVGKWSAMTGIQYVKRNGPSDFTSVAVSNVSNNGAQVCVSKFSSTDGRTWTSSFTAILGQLNSPDSAGSTYLMSGTFTLGSQLYGIGREDASGGGNNQYVTIWPMDSTTFDKQSSPAKIRLASGWSNAAYPGPTFLESVPSYVEDGLLYVFPSHGFASQVNTGFPSRPYNGASVGSGGGLLQQFIDKMVVRIDDVAARQSAPVAMGISAASGTATITWKDALPQNTYRLYRGTDATTQATLIGDYTGVTSATDSPTTGRYWYKLVTLDSGVERKSRVLSVYVSSSSAFINKHVNRVADDGGDLATCNFPFMDRADAMLDTVGIRSILDIWTHPAFCVKQSAGVISKVYDLGTTRLPRSDDFKTTTSATTYSATSVNTGPGWTNANNNSYGYWGDLQRGNTINFRRQITIVAAYERTQTTDDVTFMGTGPIFSADVTGKTAILSLTHTAGSPGNIEFSLSDQTSTKTASVAASGSGMQVAIGTYDGTSMLAYTGTTAGTAVTTLDPNPDFASTTFNPTTNYAIYGALAGSRNIILNGCCVDAGPSPFPRYYPFLGHGSIQNYSKKFNPISGPATTQVFTETNAKSKFQTVMEMNGAINSTQVGQLNTFLQSTTNW